MELWNVIDCASKMLYVRCFLLNLILFSFSTENRTFLTIVHIVIRLFIDLSLRICCFFIVFYWKARYFFEFLFNFWVFKDLSGGNLFCDRFFIEHMIFFFSLKKDCSLNSKWKYCIFCVFSSEILTFYIILLILHWKS